MSLQITTSKISNNMKDIIDSKLFIKLEDPKYGTSTRYIQPFRIINSKLTVPFAFGYRELGIERKDRKEFSIMKVVFTGVLRPEQIVVKKEAIITLSKYGSITLSLYTGFGKTITSINLACEIRLKTLIIVNTLVLEIQWKESILKVCPEGRVKILRKSTDIVDESNDFYIIHAMNVSKKSKNFFKDIGCCIVDESHLIMAETLSQSLECISPRYLIGLSATPYRVDGLDELFDFYFGPDKIIRKLYRKHIVYKVMTSFKPKTEKTKSGSLNWNLVLESQALDESRNQLIIDIICYFNTRVFLVLTKRVDQGKYLVKMLQERNENVDSLIGDEQTFDKNCRILVGTTKKCGTGFDFDRLDTLILACDIEGYFIQVLGRILRKPDTEPIVFDFVDYNRALQKHFNTRKETYEEVGGKIINFNQKYPHFFLNKKIDSSKDLEENNGMYQRRLLTKKISTK